MTRDMELVSMMNRLAWLKARLRVRFHQARICQRFSRRPWLTGVVGILTCIVASALSLRVVGAQEEPSSFKMGIDASVLNSTRYRREEDLIRLRRSFDKTLELFKDAERRHLRKHQEQAAKELWQLFYDRALKDRMIPLKDRRMLVESMADDVELALDNFDDEALEILLKSADRVYDDNRQPWDREVVTTTLVLGSLGAVPLMYLALKISSKQRSKNEAASLMSNEVSEKPPSSIDPGSCSVAVSNVSDDMGIASTGAVRSKQDLRRRFYRRAGQYIMAVNASSLMIYALWTRSHEPARQSDEMMKDLRKVLRQYQE